MKYVFRAMVCLAGSGVFWGCGEFETLELPQYPPRQDFVAVQEVLVSVGCSGDEAQGCHRTLIADFRITEEPKSDQAREDELLLTKSKIDLLDPDQSVLLRVALRGDAKSLSHPICFSSVDSCAYRKIIAWIRWGGEDDERPDDIECQVEDDSCFNMNDP